ncbi:hypothetical protein KY290_036827 [Solanum tuberosum]|uniref:Transposase, Ptta/En/Spm, plant n=1 Tax=Solanum tuberosum TaxID=4113 RepID=A0ABQ7TVH3_SOLTU|nr:hypothetical protein KY289_036302 [Solanum tuberosum]KAH0639563.1 hypothetical protein KY285_036149 [Solanum tuberosum]KAH0738122.1 hypothetical protein KY290_036827 [Solanum tuberosum]
MVDKDKGKSKKSANPKKKVKANVMRRPTGVVISDEPSRVNISKRPSVSTTHSAHQSHNASTHVAPQSGYTISTPTVVPSSGYQILKGYSHLSRGSTIPSSSASQCNSLNTSSGSIGLSNLHLEFNGSEPNTPTTQHSDAHGPQPGDRDNFRRLVIEPLGYNLRPDVGMAKIILKCIGTHYNGVYPNWSSIPLNTQGQMFNEFKKYYVWALEHEDDVQVNFKLKASKLLSSTFCDCRRENRMPGFMLPDRWALLLKHWSTDEKFKKRSEIGKMARASENGGSLHTGGAISQVTRKERMEKELGRPVDVAEMFKVTHVKKSTNSTKEERWIEPRAQETYDRYIRISQEYRSTLPLESQDRPFTQEENENLWKQSAGEPIRGSIYGYPEKAYQKKKSWYCGSSSSSFDGGDRETISIMESNIAYLNAELAAVAEREKKREEKERKREEEIAAAKEVENKSSDGSDQEGDENDKSDKESEGDENGKSDKESEGDEE